jgi:uncharacterized protein
MPQRLISADDHVDLSHDKIKSFLDPRYHDAYSQALRDFGASMGERFPELKVVFVEPGVGWVAWWLYIADDLKARQGYDFPGLKEAPSEYFRQSVYVTFIDEPDVVRHAHDIIGISNVMWSSDYPHPVTSWPHSQAIAGEVTQGVSAAERELILSGNAARVWNL